MIATVGVKSGRGYFYAQSKMKKYWYFQIVLCSYERVVKVVKDMAYYCTEERMHEIAFELCKKLEDAGMAFNGTNAQRYFEVQSQEAPSPDELNSILQNANLAN